MNPVVRFLSDEEIKQRYPEENQSTRARLSREAVQKGYKIALVESSYCVSYPCDGNLENALYYAEGFLNLLIPEHRRELWCFTDLGETPQGRVYCAIREK